MPPLTHLRTHVHMYAWSSHIRMFGHLLLNQLPIFHICHGPHILPPPSIFFPPPGDLFPPYLEPVQILHSFAFSLDTVFSSVAGFPFELNQINLRPDKDTVSVCVGEGRQWGKWDVCALWWPSLAHTSSFQLSFIVIIATAVAPLCCLLSSKACTWLWMLELLLASILACGLQYFTRCASLYTSKTASSTTISIKESWFFLNEEMPGYSRN